MLIDQHEVRVTAGGVQLQFIDSGGTISADRGWTPHVQGSLTVREPASLATTAPGSEITVELTQRFGDFALTRDLTALYSGLTTAALTTAFSGGTSATITALVTAGSWNTPVRAATGRTLTLIITERQRSRGKHTLTVASHEVLVQDWVWYDVDGAGEAVSVTFEANTATEYLQNVIALHAAETLWVGSSMPPVRYRATPVSISPTTHTIDVGKASIGSAYAFLTISRQRLYSPGDGILYMVDYPHNPGGEITVAEQVNLIDWEIADERTKNAVVKFTGTPTNPAARPVYHSSPFPELNAPAETYIDSPSQPVLLSGLINGITAQVTPFLDRVGLDESPVKLVTINDYSVMPGAAIAYTLPDEAEETDTIDAITWQLGGRFEMDIWV